MALADPLTQSPALLGGNLSSAPANDDILNHEQIAASTNAVIEEEIRQDVAAVPLRPQSATSSSYPVSNLKLEDRHIDDVRSLRVTVIGAGLAGINAGILLPAKVPGIQLTILEKNVDVVSTVVPFMSGSV